MLNGSNVGFATAIDVKAPAVVVDEKQVLDLEETSFPGTVTTMAAKGMGANIVSATGPSHNPLIERVNEQKAAYPAINQTQMHIDTLEVLT